MEGIKMKLKKAGSGFSLIEVLVSLSLVSLLITMTAELIVFSLMAKKKADSTTTQSRLAAGKLESLKAVPFDAEELREGEYSKTVRDGRGQNHRLQWRVENAAGGMKRVSVDVHPENAPEKPLSMGVYLLRELGPAP